MSVDLVHRFDADGPRYTSFPTADRFVWPPVRTRRGLAGVEMQTGFWLQAQKLRAIRA